MSDTPSGDAPSHGEAPPHGDHSPPATSTEPPPPPPPPPPSGPMRPGGMPPGGMYPGGAMPYPPGPGSHQPRRPNRKPLAIGVGLVAVAAIIGAVIALTGSDDEAEEATDIDEAEPASDETGGQADGTVRVVDSGFSVYTDPQGVPIATWGAVFENTTDAPQMHVPFSVTLYDAAGHVLAQESSHFLPFQAEQTLGFGDVILDVASAEPATRVEIDIGDPENFEGLRIPSDGELQVSNIATHMDSLGPATTYTVTSTHDEEVNGNATAVYYDAAGDIIGGAWQPLLGPVPPNGTVTGDIQALRPDGMPAIDRTEVYIAVQPGL